MIKIMSEKLFAKIARYPHRRIALERDAVLFRRDEVVKSIFLIEDGSIELVRFTEGGDQLILQRAGAGSILAEASLYAQNYHCDGIASMPTLALKFSKSKLRAAIHNDQALVELWGAYLSSVVQNARSRAEILNLKTVSNRLDGWLALNGKQLPPKGDWHRLAAEIGVTPEALYREMAKRRM